MQPKTIKSVLRRKFEAWRDSITDEHLRDLVERDTLCSGGAIANMLRGDPVNDFDFYFKTKETTKKVAEYYVALLRKNPPNRFKKDGAVVPILISEEGERIQIIVKSQGIASDEGATDYQYFEMTSDPSEPHEFVQQVAKVAENPPATSEKPSYRPVFVTTNAITLSDGIQIIIRFYGSIEEIHRNYDFVHCLCSWESDTGALTLPHESLICLLNKRLKYKHSLYPLCSLIRTRKFLTRGWAIDAGQYVKMAWDVRKLNLEDRNVLEDQLVGVDSAYFEEVLSLLKQQQEAKKDIDGTYLMEVIDRVFG